MNDDLSPTPDCARFFGKSVEEWIRAPASTELRGEVRRGRVRTYRAVCTKGELP